MRVFVIRHGKAEEDSTSGRDYDRVLKPKGERQVKYLADQLAAAARPPVMLLVSPFARAVQTARPIADAVGCPLVIAPELEVGRPTSDVLALIEEHRASGAIALVGHNPQLGELVSILSRSPAAGEARMRTGEAVVIDLGRSHAVGSGTILASLRMPEHVHSGCEGD